MTTSLIERNSGSRRETACRKICCAGPAGWLKATGPAGLQRLRRTADQDAHEQCLGARVYTSVDGLHQAVAAIVELYDIGLIQTPRPPHTRESTKTDLATRRQPPVTQPIRPSDRVQFEGRYLGRGLAVAGLSLSNAGPTDMYTLDASESRLYLSGSHEVGCEFLDPLC